MRRYPADHQVVARSEAATLEDLVDNVHRSHHYYHPPDESRSFSLAGNHYAYLVGKAQYDTGPDTDNQAQGKVPAGIGAVTEYSVDKFGDAVNQSSQGHYYTEAGIGDAIFLLKQRDGEGEVLANEVEHCVAYHRADDDAPLPVLESLFFLHCR